MCRAACVLVLLAQYVWLAHSWDIAISLRDQLVFYTNGTKTDTVNLISQNPASLVYDEVHNIMLYVDKQNNNDAIFGYNLSSKENKCYIERNGRSISSLAFDPVTEIIFFTDTIARSINFISLKAGSINNVNGNLLIQLDDKAIPADIAVDSCRGYIYWISSTTDNPYTKFERALFNGSEREVLFGPLTYYEALSLAIDLQTQQVFYLDRCAGCKEKNLYVSGANLYLKNRTSLLETSEEVLTQPKTLTVSKDYIYFTNRSESYDTVWQLPKSAKLYVDQPKEIIKFYGVRTLGITANYKIDDQIKGIQDCDSLSSVKVESAITEPSDGTGERCNVSACENYCLQGNCSVNDEGLPKCSCIAGYSGERCEVAACHGYCLNNGACSLNEEDMPFCECVGNHEGTRCETEINTTPTYDLAKQNLTIADLLSILRKPSSKMYLTVEV